VTLPSDVQRVLNARADDAIRAIYTAVEDGNRSDLEFATRELLDVLEDEEAAKQEFTG
jgi:hypothetical protein